eukprot:SAG22_NODE_801_length_7103_cov_18.044832_4_plen_187_part_00
MNPSLSLSLSVSLSLSLSHAEIIWPQKWLISLSLLSATVLGMMGGLDQYYQSQILISIEGRDRQRMVQCFASMVMSKMCVGAACRPASPQCCFKMLPRDGLLTAATARSLAGPPAATALTTAACPLVRRIELFLALLNQRFGRVAGDAVSLVLKERVSVAIISQVQPCTHHVEDCLHAAAAAAQPQ